MFVHIPLTEHEPLSLFEHLPIPQMVDNILLTVEGPRNILATDFEGRRGLEMSELDLLRCKTEDLAVGKLYVCPNTNLIRNNIRNSCLGSMFFGHTKKMMEKCHIFPSISEEEFAEQVSEDSVTYFSKANTTIIETCSNRMRMINNTGLNTIKTRPGCKVFTEDYTFVLPSLIEEETNFVKRIDKIPQIDFFPDRNTKEIREQLEVLHMMKSTQKVDLSTLNNWIKKNQAENYNHQLGYSSSTIVATVMVMGILIYLFVRYRRSQKSNTPK
jgi:hypothetical protein